MVQKKSTSNMTGFKSGLVAVIFILLSGLIVYGLYSVSKKSPVEQPSSAPLESVGVSSEEVIPVDVSLSDAELTVGVGNVRAIEANGGSSIRWSTSDVKVATVSADGSVQGVGVGQCDITAENEFGRTSQCRVTVKKVIYITVDDCPMGCTKDILDVLKKYNVKATFFVVNTYNNRMLRRINEEGHCIGLHTYSHTFKKCYRSQYSYFADLEKLADIVEYYTGKRPKIMRFPGGTGNHVGGKLNMRRMVNGVSDLGYRAFDWTSSSGDATRPRPTAEQAAHNALVSCTRDSEILLTHDKPCSAGALEIMIPILRKRGYIFETLDHHPETSHMSKSWYERTVSTDEIPCEYLTPDRESAELLVDKSFTLKVSMTPDTSTDYVRFESDDPKIASVTLEGVVSGKKPGTVAIRAIATSGQEAVCFVKVVTKLSEPSEQPSE